ncbi:flagellar basal body rod modification protein [Paracoccus limosus]|uniref:Basal-body rod modification protein FlgD n=1 Tax=Paracoccus limosus TaxID=913252 RepID=A0A844H151_9RHOB|nr:flagellar hook capping FlgD N-terminal domain-containing protein [Paracoccus limosus]MTH32981.1 flagellar basal body rod modification protein [Paracoccus limosus]
MVTSIAGATTTNTTARANAAASPSATNKDDFETFLRMLTTQLQNQDPLKPMESTEFAVQLATFSGVEQQVQTNDLLAQMLATSSGGTLGQLSDWIGREVRTTVPVWFSGDPITLQIEPKKGADAVNLVALDEAGKEVYRESIGTGSGEVDWRGSGADDKPLAKGLYHFRLESLKDGKVISTQDVPAYSRVTGAELTDKGGMLVLAGNNKIAPSEVSAVRQ